MSQRSCSFSLFILSFEGFSIFDEKKKVKEIAINYKMRLSLGFLLLANVTAYSIQGKSGSPTATLESSLSRRGFGLAVASIVGSCGFLLQNEPALAKSTQEEIDKQNILKGYVSL